MPDPVPQSVRDKIPEAVRRLGSMRAAAAELGVSFHTVKLYAGVAAEKPAGYSRTEDGDGATISYETETRIRTLADALRYAEVDTAVWRVHSWECTSWEVVAKVKHGQGKPDSLARKTLWRVRLTLRRIVPRAVESGAEAWFARLAAKAPKWPTLPTPKRTAAYLLELDLFDVHVGKLAWQAETGEDYDTRLAVAIYRNAAEDLLSETPYPLERAIVPVGQDFLHIDGLTPATTAGTPQDADGRWAKIFEAALEAVTGVIDRLATRCPVSVCWVPGNHDRLTSWHLVRTLGAYYRQCPRIEVDYAPTARKYVRYGANLIGYTHGDEEKHVALPTLMATEKPAEWAATRWRKWRLGHFHKAKQTDHVSVDTHEGVEVRILGSLSGRDAWHYRKGYLSNRAADAFVHHRDRGFVAHYTAHARAS